MTKRLHPGNFWHARADHTGGLNKYAIVAFGLLIRVIALARVGGGFLYYENTAYDRMALQLLHGVSFAPYWPPGVPYYLMAFHSVFGEGLLVARASMLLMYVAFSFALHALVRELWSRRAADVTVLVFALYPSYVRWSFNPSTEFPAAACLVVVVWLAILAVRRESLALAAVLGLVLGIFALVRGSSLGLVALTPLFVWLRTRRVTLAVVPVLIAAAPISAWLWKAHEMTGRFVPINDSNAENFFQSNNACTPLYNTCIGGPIPWKPPARYTQLAQEIECQPPEQRQQSWRALAMEHIRSRPDLFLLRTFNRFRAFFCFPIHRGEPITGATLRGWLGLGITAAELCFYWPIMAAAIIVCFSRRLDAGVMALVLAAVFVYAAPCFLTCSQPRYNFPIVPLFAALAAGFIERPSMPRRNVAMWLVLAFFAYIQIEWIVLVATS